MRKQKTILSFLQKLSKVLEDEVADNPRFAAKLATALGPAAKNTKAGKAVAKGRTAPKAAAKLPDLYDECLARGPEEFHFWLRGMPVDTLKDIVKANDMDPAHRAARWKDAEKLARRIFEQTQARMKRGSGFLPPVPPPPVQTVDSPVKSRARPGRP